MRLELDASLGAHYASASQWARRVTEGWALDNLYCLACSSDSLQAHVANRAVEDYHCPLCRRNVQLKAKQGSIGHTVSNSAYAKKESAIKEGAAPDYCFMAYDRAELAVTDVIWVPGHFITLSVISKREPLRATAQRAGWIGSNIHLDRIPSRGKIPVVSDSKPWPTRTVREQFRQLAFVQTLDADGRGWLTDVLACLDGLGLRAGSHFSNADVFQFETDLARLHPKNNNIRPKIRQQLQLLEAHGLVTRLRPGHYRRL